MSECFLARHRDADDTFWRVVGEVGVGPASAWEGRLPGIGDVVTCCHILVVRRVIVVVAGIVRVRFQAGVEPEDVN